MRKISYLFVSILALGFASCSDDDSGGNDAGDTSGELVDQWRYSQEGVSAQGQEVLTDYVHADCDFDYIDIKAGGIVDMYEYEDAGTECDEFVTEENYTRNGNNISLEIGGVTYDATIMTLNSSTLKIGVPYTSEGQTYYAVTVYTRQ